MSVKIFHFDTETTGTKDHLHGIHQLSGMIEIDGVIMERFNFHMRPHPLRLKNTDPKALELGGVTMQQIRAYPPMDGVHQQIIRILAKYVDQANARDKFYPSGFNAAYFDVPFFQAFFQDNNDPHYKDWFHSGVLDSFTLSLFHLLCNGIVVDNFKQSTIARALGIPVDVDQLHRGEYDVEIHYQILQKVTPCQQKLSNPNYNPGSGIVLP